MYDMVTKVYDNLKLYACDATGTMGRGVVHILELFPVSQCYFKLFSFLSLPRYFSSPCNSIVRHTIWVQPGHLAAAWSQNGLALITMTMITMPVYDEQG